MGKIRVNSVMKNPSLCDGYGYRTVVFLQGCDLHCQGCHNKGTWAIDKGTLMEVSDLAALLREQSINKKVTISGGEPLLQKEAVIELLRELSDFDLCLYTGHELEEVPEEILKYLKYIKVGRFILEQRTSTTPFVGSKNQKFVRIHHEEAK
ncbi:MAG: radical SAM protein [Candidatus Cloacimonetes bacterium]|nr:radical SAM protein [Candidatus Cloacimonadota bacterium]